MFRTLYTWKETSEAGGKVWIPPKRIVLQDELIPRPMPQSPALPGTYCGGESSESPPWRPPSPASCLCSSVLCGQQATVSSTSHAPLHGSTNWLGLRCDWAELTFFLQSRQELNSWPSSLSIALASTEPPRNSKARRAVRQLVPFILQVPNKYCIFLIWLFKPEIIFHPLV